MTLVVTLNVFSGRSNPVWVLPDTDAREFGSRVDAISTVSNLKAPGAVAGDLGYRGFSVRHAEGTQLSYVHAGVVDGGGLSPSLLAVDRELESWLLSTAPADVDQAVRDHVREQIDQVPPAAVALRLDMQAAVACPACKAADAPAYNPSIWNTPPVQPRNNCYNYANDQITNTFAQPGRATGKPMTAMSCPGVQPSSVSDGLVASPNFTNPLPAGSGWYVALVIWPGNDYHWYRQDRVGCWSHKPGQTAARNTDNHGQTIADPQTCARGPYTQFCSYMVTKKTVRIR